MGESQEVGLVRIRHIPGSPDPESSSLAAYSPQLSGSTFLMALVISS